MISIDEALRIVMERVHPIKDIEEVDLMSARRRVLAEDITSDTDIAPFDKSAMDGYAVIAELCPGQFDVIEEIPAGYVPTKKVVPGVVSKIMTGAPVPEGADSVVMVEKTEESKKGEKKVKILTQVKKGENIIRQGEDVRKGEVVLKKGTVLGPADISVCATVGKKRVSVFNQMKVAILATGTELVEPDEIPSFGKIRNSNSYSLFSQVQSAGAIPEYLGIASDSEVDLSQKIKEGLNYDLLLISGGVSVGDFDLVPHVLKDCGVKIEFHKVCIKPGKPTVFGLTDKTVIFGMPGNPVSTLVIFELFVRQAIYKMSGRNVNKEPFFSAILKEDFKRKKSERDQIIPVRLFFENEVLKALPIEYHGSAHILALSEANGLLRIPKDVFTLNKGDECQVRWLFH